MGNANQRTGSGKGNCYCLINNHGIFSYEYINISYFIAPFLLCIGNLTECCYSRSGCAPLTMRWLVVHLLVYCHR